MSAEAESSEEAVEVRLARLEDWCCELDERIFSVRQGLRVQLLSAAAVLECLDP